MDQKGRLMGLHRHVLKIPADIDLRNERAGDIAVEIIWPENIQPAVAFFCLPGGSMNRRYYDLAAEGDTSFSFASAMAGRGMMTISIDHLGIGDSFRPSDGFVLTPDRIMRANANVAAHVLDGLRAGSLMTELEALPRLIAVGVGHSMGAMLTVMQQAFHPLYDALLLLGFGNRGLISHLPKPAHHLIDNHEAVKAEIEDVARKIYESPCPRMKPSPEASKIFYGEKADRAGVSALKAARDALLVVAGLQSMIPGSFAPSFEKITAPIFLGLGDSDIAGPPHDTPAIFQNSRDITLLVLEETGHCQFIFPSRGHLFGRIGDWAAAIVRQRQLKQI
jgi:pimeloyl-ACP methyl ester carboxylesterase